jgi:metallophosphoesterase (TIGR00282 family)
VAVRILNIAEIVSKAGIFCLKSQINAIKNEYQADFVMINGDGCTSGYGIGKNHSIYLNKLGVNCITTGDQTFFKKDIQPHIEYAPYMVRPANFPPGAPGRGWRYFDLGDKKVAILSLLGMSGFNRLHVRNPFGHLPEIVDRIKKETPIILFDFHSCITAEKAAMAFHADGLVSAMLGTGMKCQTAESKIYPKGTAVVLDTGRTGSLQSVGGFRPDAEIEKFMTGVPNRSLDAWDGLEIQGAMVEIGDDGKAIDLQVFRKAVATPEKTDKSEPEKASA